ncbi:MAG: HAD family hydrolase [Marmoricola sp.]
MPIDTAIFDIDGTLVDSNYQHIEAWSRAFGDRGIHVPTWVLHDHMGMGGDQLVAEVAGDEVETDLGDELRAAWSEAYDALLDRVRPFASAAALLSRTAALGTSVVLATSGKPEHTTRALQLLGLDDHSYPIVTSEEVGATKPAPDLVEAALAAAGGRSGLVIGDTVWDVRAAGRAGLPAVALRTGGTARCVLDDAGAVSVYDDPTALLANLEMELRHPAKG